MTHTTLNVQGMSCGHCKAAVEGELNRLTGVEYSNADFERGAVEVRYDEGRVTAEDLEAAVEKAGYAVAS
jgi:copper chaperone